MIRHLTADELRTGMTIATPVHGSDGRILCAAGAVLTERMVSRLRGMGLDRVAVVVESPSDREESVRRIKHRFRRALNDPTMVELCELFARASMQRSEASTVTRGASADAAADPEAQRQPSPLGRFVRACLGGGQQAKKAVR